MPRTQRPAGHDEKCPDGFSRAGWRRICSGGYIRLQHGRHYHDRLIQHVGQWVFAEIADCWGINADAWMDAPYTGEKLQLINEKDWTAQNPEASNAARRRRESRICN